MVISLHQSIPVGGFMFQAHFMSCPTSLKPNSKQFVTGHQIAANVKITPFDLKHFGATKSA